MSILEDIIDEYLYGKLLARPAHYFTASGLAYDTAHNFIGVKLELLSEPDLLMMFENATRRGVTMTSHRHDKANDPYISGYGAEQPTKYFI